VSENSLYIQLGHESLDVTLGYFKGRMPNRKKRALAADGKRAAQMQLTSAIRPLCFPPSLPL
jgi:hypothetical protein